MNIFEDVGVNFRVVEWNVGNSVDECTSVTVQGMSFNDQALEDAEQRIREECKKHGITVIAAVGPDYEKKILSKTNQQNTH